MGALVVRLGADQYLRWSNTTDAPMSWVIGRDALIELLQSEGRLSFGQARHLLDVASDRGTSPDVELSALVANNRAGSGERRLSVEELLREYQVRG